MPAHKYPVFIWKDWSGMYTAAPIEDLDISPGDDDELAVVASSKTEALYELKKSIAWFSKKWWWIPEPELVDVSVSSFTVPIRTETKIKKRVFPDPESLRLRVECVHGRLDTDLFLASFPSLGLRFTYFSDDNLKDLVLRYIQDHFRGYTVRELSRFLPYETSWLDHVVVRVDYAGSRSRSGPPKFPWLSETAEPMIGRGNKAKTASGPAWEREKELASLVQWLADERTSILLVGENGAGKSTLLQEAVRRVCRKDEDRQTERFWRTSGQHIIAGMKYLGQWQERCEGIISELEQVGGVLCVNSLLELILAGGSDAGDGVAQFLAPYIKMGELRMVLEATPAEQERCRRLLPGFVELFQPLNVPELHRDQVLKILHRFAAQQSRQKSIDMEKEVPELIYRLFRRFQPYSSFPGKVVQFLDTLFEQAGRDGATEVTRHLVMNSYIRATGLGEIFLRDDLQLHHTEVLNSLRSEIIGQDAACSLAADLIVTFKAGLNDPTRPVGVLFFCGPTGVGKTKLAKEIARYCFGHGDGNDDERLVRLDMSEYAVPGSSSRLLGDPRSGGGKFIKTVRNQPFSVVLFDEIEKADQEIFDLILNLLDEGRLTDTYGRITYFQSTIIIMTSNLAVRHKPAIGFGEGDGISYEREIMKFFRPEFFNRIDEIVPFSALDPSDILAITRKELNEITWREGLRKRGIEVEWDEELVEYVSRKGYHPQYGARNLQRTIEEMIALPLAEFLLDNRELRNCQIQCGLGEAQQIIISH